MRCEHRIDPEGIDAAAPRLSWWTAGPGPQLAYRIVVGSTPDGPRAADVWDSGRVDGDASVLLPYAGPPLQSRQRCWWAVATWNEGGDGEPAWSDPARWSMGLLDPADWSATWVAGPVERAEDGAAVALFRRSFTPTQPVVAARAFATALGLYRMHLNGEPVSDDRLTPGWTDYRRRVQVQAYDLTARIRPGANELLVELGEGWYCGHAGPDRGRDHYGTRPELLVQVELDHADGTRTVVGTDGRWQATTGPRRWSDLLMGERCDARRVSGPWATATPGDGPPGPAALVASPSQAVRVTEERPAVAMWRPPGAPPGTYVFDLGQNIVGWARLRTGAGAALPAGTELTLRFAETTDGTDDGDGGGTIYTDNLRGARATDRYVAAGGPFTYEPAFSVHGFRYVELSGWPADATGAGSADEPDLATVTGLVAHTDLEATGTFACSSPLVERIFANTVWSQRGNFVDIPTDCPQRDERLGWTGDAGVFAGTAAYTMDVAAFFTKWLTDVDDAVVDGAFPDVAPRIAFTNEGAPGWGDAGVIVPWTMHERYGDDGLLARHYPAMAAWVDRVAAHNPDGVWAHHTGNDYGDWLCVDAIAPKRVVATAFFARSAALTAAAATALGHADDAARFGALAATVAAAFRTAFVAPDGRIEGDGGLGEAQTSYALALRFGLVDGDLRDAVAARLVDDVERRGHLTTGFVGVKHLLPALTDAGRVDLAYRLLEHEGYPSWGYSIAQGATTMWERWDGWTAERGFQDPLMNSFNHYAFGAVSEWLFDTVAGIQPAAPGFRRVRVAPRPGGSLTWAAATYRSVRGEIASRWQRDGAAVVFDVDVPPAVDAELVLPPEAGGGSRPLAPGHHRIEATWTG